MVGAVELTLLPLTEAGTFQLTNAIARRSPRNAEELGFRWDATNFLAFVTNSKIWEVLASFHPVCSLRNRDENSFNE